MRKLCSSTETKICPVQLLHFTLQLIFLVSEKRVCSDQSFCQVTLFVKIYIFTLLVLLIVPLLKSLGFALLNNCILSELIDIYCLALQDHMTRHLHCPTNNVQDCCNTKAVKDCRSSCKCGTTDPMWIKQYVCKRIGKNTSHW